MSNSSCEAYNAKYQYVEAYYLFRTTHSSFVLEKSVDILILIIMFLNTRATNLKKKRLKIKIEKFASLKILQSFLIFIFLIPFIPLNYFYVFLLICINANNNVLQTRNVCLSVYTTVFINHRTVLNKNWKYDSLWLCNPTVLVLDLLKK